MRGRIMVVNNSRRIIKLWPLFLAWLAFRTVLSMETNAAESEQSIPVWVTNSELPRGQGLAAGYVGDEMIASHQAVIFADNFEIGALGAKWDQTNNRGDKVLALVDQSSDRAPVGSRSLRVTATLGENNGGGFTKWFESSNQIFIRFYTKFDPACDYVHHFCTLRANKSLQGSQRWSGFGKAGELPDGRERFSTAIEPWGNWRKWQPPGRWNFYSYWHTMLPSADGKYWGNGFRPETQSNIERGKWLCVEMMIQHNTPNQNDGEQAYWIDGKLAGHWKCINWRTSPTLFANAFTLESYVTDRWTKQPVNIVYFDNVVIAKQYIGPAQNKMERPAEEHPTCSAAACTLLEPHGFRAGQPDGHPRLALETVGLNDDRSHDGCFLASYACPHSS